MSINYYFFSSGYVTVNGEVKRVTGPITGSTNNNNRNSGAVMVGVVSGPQTTEYVEEVIEAEGIIVASEPPNKKPRNDYENSVTNDTD